MVKKAREQMRTKAVATTRPKKEPEATEEQVDILQKAIVYCLRHFPMLWTTGGLPEERQEADGSLRWIIHVYLRYPTGHEGYLGDLLYDGKEFTQLADLKTMRAARGKSPPTPSECENGMSIELPLYRQMKDETCALACLRMVLAAFGTEVAESTLEAQVQMEESGTPIEEVERLARQYQLVAQIQEATAAELGSILAAGKLTIVSLDRAVFGLRPRHRRKYVPRDPKIHTVIPSHISPAYVTFHDPLPPRIARRTIEVFELAQKILGRHCVVCARAKDR